METTKVGIREFRADIAEYIASNKPVAITRHGQTVGFFIPTHSYAEADVAALKKASATLARLLAAKSVMWTLSSMSSSPCARRKSAGANRPRRQHEHKSHCARREHLDSRRPWVTVAKQNHRERKVGPILHARRGL